jgi:hypothetical protein
VGAFAFPLLARLDLAEATLLTLGTGSTIITSIIGATVGNKICDVINEASED